MTIGIILLVIALAEFALGLYFIFRYVRSPATIWYGLFCISAAIYVGANGLGYALDSFYIGERFGWAGGILTGAFFLPFSFTYPIPERQARDLLPLVLWPAAVFILPLLLTNLFIADRGIVYYRGGYQTTPGDYFWFMILMFVVYWAWSILNLVRHHRRSDGIHRWQLRMILIGIITSLAVAIVFDIIYPFVTTSRVGYVGSLFTSIWLGFTSYILVKK